MAMKGEPGTPLPKPDSKTPDVSIRPRPRSGLASPSIVIRSKRFRGRGVEGITVTVDVAGLYCRGQRDVDVGRRSEHPVGPRDVDVVSVIAQIGDTAGIERLAEREQDGRDPGRAQHELLARDLGRDRIRLSARVVGGPGHDGQRGRAHRSKLAPAVGPESTRPTVLVTVATPPLRIGTVNVAVVWLARKVSVPETGV